MNEGAFGAKKFTFNLGSLSCLAKAIKFSALSPYPWNKKSSFLGFTVASKNGPFNGFVLFIKYVKYIKRLEIEQKI